MRLGYPTIISNWQYTLSTPTSVMLKTQKSAGKWILTVGAFCLERGGGGNTKDVLLKDYLPSGNVINEQYYGDLLTGYRKTFSRKQEIADIHLLQDNTSSCEVQLMTNDMNVQTPIPGIFS